MYTYLCTKIIILYELSHVISKDLDGAATEADGRATEAEGRASAPVGPSVATPLPICSVQPANLLCLASLLYPPML